MAEAKRVEAPQVSPDAVPGLNMMLLGIPMELWGRIKLLAYRDRKSPSQVLGEALERYEEKKP